jgi:membrane associated rhomboid family serine protease
MTVSGDGSRGSQGGRDAESMIAEARSALWVMVGFLALIWAVQIINWADDYRLSTDYGIKTRDLAGLPDIITAPFLHLNWSHIEGNSGPLFIFGFLAAYRGVKRFLGLTVLVVLVSGFGAWLTSESGTVTVGASGVVFGYFGYVIVKGAFDRHVIDIVIGLVMALCFAYQFSVLLPHQGISWQGHIAGFAAGIAGGWIFRERRPKVAAGGAGPSGPVTSGSTKPLPAGSASSNADLLKELDDMGL